MQLYLKSYWKLTINGLNFTSIPRLDYENWFKLLFSALCKSQRNHFSMEEYFICRQTILTKHKTWILLDSIKSNTNFKHDPT